MRAAEKMKDDDDDFLAADEKHKREFGEPVGFRFSVFITVY